jgi:hypothetical protein
MITNEKIAKAFLPYIGVTAVFNFGQQKLFGVTKSMFEKQEPNKWIALFEDENEEYVEDCALLLKPLSAITDEEILEVAKIEGLANAKITDRNDYKIEITDDTYIFLLNFKGEICLLKNKYVHEIAKPLAIYQFLQEKGYDLPSWHLGGKTLKEAGYAVYAS